MMERPRNLIGWDFVSIGKFGLTVLMLSVIAGCSSKGPKQRASSSSVSSISSVSSSASSSSMSSSSSSLGPVIRYDLPVTDGLVVRLDAADLSLSSGEAVTHWPSTSPLSVSADSLGEAPSYVRDSISEQPGVRFTASTAGLVLSENIFSMPQGTRTIFAVVNASDYKGVVVGGQHSSAETITDGGVALGIAAGKPFFKAIGEDAANGSWLLAGYKGQETSLTVLGASFSDSQASLMDNCHRVSSDTPPVYELAGQQAVIGVPFSSGRFEGDINEILVYDRSLTEEEQGLLRDYVSLRYGVTLPAMEDEDLDGIFDDCDENVSYLGAPDISVTLEAPGELVDQVSVNALIDLTSALDFDPHFSTTHIYNKEGAITALIDLNGVYELRQAHVWNYTEEPYDADTITLIFLDGVSQEIERVNLNPKLGFGRILAEDFDIDVEGVSYIRVIMTSSNQDTEVMNIGFSGVPILL